MIRKILMFTLLTGVTYLFGVSVAAESQMPADSGACCLADSSCVYTMGEEACSLLTSGTGFYLGDGYPCLKVLTEDSAISPFNEGCQGWIIGGDNPNPLAACTMAKTNWYTSAVATIFGAGDVILTYFEPSACPYTYGPWPFEIQSVSFSLGGP